MMAIDEKCVEAGTFSHFLMSFSLYSLSVSVNNVLVDFPLTDEEAFESGR